jgi:glutamyl-tRNA synthetase
VHSGGTLVLRNEDLDQERSKGTFYKAMVEDLHWLGVRWQEGPDVGGPHGPYSQSERSELYAAAWRRLRDGGYVYPCKCSRRELVQVASAPHESKDDEGPRYPGTCRPTNGKLNGMQESPKGANWRFRVPDGEVIAFQDRHFGPQKFVAGRDFGDFPIWRRDGVPSYQLACVVDDGEMRITEVVRGADLLLSTARQILLYRALGLEAPAWCHCPLVTDVRGVRLAKRHDALSLRTLRQEGKEPQDLTRLLAGAA